MENRLKFFRGYTQKTIEEIEQYHYAPQDDDRPTADKPVAKNNHAMDALRYAFSRPMQGLYTHRPSNNKKKLRVSPRAIVSDPITGY